jgi:hypothetical protein
MAKAKNSPRRRTPFLDTKRGKKMEASISRARTRARAVTAKYASDGAIVKNSAYIAGGGGALAGYLNSEYPDGFFGQDGRLVAGAGLMAAGLVGLKGEMKASACYVAAGTLACYVQDQIEEML